MTWPTSMSGSIGRVARKVKVLRAFTFGHVRQLKRNPTVRGRPPRVTRLLTSAGELVHLDVDDNVRAAHGLPPAGRLTGQVTVAVVG